MRLFAILSLVLLLTGCAYKPGTGSYADAATTGVVLAQGGAEINPIIGWHPDPLVTVVTALGVKQGAKYALEGVGYSHCQSNRLIEIAGWFGAGWNLPLLLATGGLAIPYTLASGSLAAYTYYKLTSCEDRNDYSAN